MRIYKITILVFFLSFLFVSDARAQAYSGSACTSALHPELKTAVAAGQIPAQQGIAYAFYEAWASTSLKSSAPQAQTQKNLDPEEEERQAEERDKITCKFTPQSLTDADSKTAWCEGVVGDGVGEVALAFLTPQKVPQKLKIWNGYAKSPETFANNNRVANMRIHFFTSEVFSGHFSSSEETLVPEQKRVAQMEVTLKDSNALQDVVLPNEILAKWPIKPNQTAVIGIEILSVYRGKQHQDTCLTEIGLE